MNANVTSALIAAPFVFAFIVGCFALLEKGAVKKYQYLASVCLSIPFAALGSYLFTFSSGSPTSAANPPPTTSNQIIGILPILISVIPLVLTVLTSIAFVFTRNALVDIREEKKRIEEALGVSKKVEAAVKDIADRSWAIKQQELRVHLLSEIAKLAPYATEADNLTIDRLNHLQQLFVGDGAGAKLPVLRALVGERSIRNHIEVEHVDFIRELPGHFSTDQEIKEVVDQLMQALREDRRS